MKINNFSRRIWNEQRWKMGYEYSNWEYQSTAKHHQQKYINSLWWRHNGRDGVSNHQPHHCLLNSSADQRKNQSSASLAFVGGIHRGPVNSRHKWSVTRKMFPFDDVIMLLEARSGHVNEWWYKLTNNNFMNLANKNHCIDRYYHQ